MISARSVPVRSIAAPGSLLLGLRALAGSPQDAIRLRGNEHAFARVEPLEARDRDVWQRVLARVAC